MNVAGIPKLTGTHHGSIIQWFIYITLQLCEGCKHPLSHNTLVNATIPFNSAPKKCFFFLFRFRLHYYRASAHWSARQHTDTRDIDIAILSVCLSIHPSVRCIPVFYRNDSTYCLVSSPHDCPVILILWVSNIFAKFWRGHTLRGAKYRSDIKKNHDFHQ